MLTTRGISVCNQTDGAIFWKRKIETRLSRIRCIMVKLTSTDARYVNDLIWNSTFLGFNFCGLQNPATDTGGITTWCWCSLMKYYPSFCIVCRLLLSRLNRSFLVCIRTLNRSHIWSQHISPSFTRFSPSLLCLGFHALLACRTEHFRVLHLIGFALPGFFEVLSSCRVAIMYHFI